MYTSYIGVIYCYCVWAGFKPLRGITKTLLYLLDLYRQPATLANTLRFSESRLQRVIFKHDSFRLGTLHF